MGELAECLTELLMDPVSRVDAAVVCAEGERRQVAVWRLMSGHLRQGVIHFRVVRQQLVVVGDSEGLEIRIAAVSLVSFSGNCKKTKFAIFTAHDRCSGIAKVGAHFAR